MSKKISFILLILVFLTLISTIGMFFVMLRLRNESEGFFLRRLEALANAQRQEAVQRENWNVSRNMFAALTAEARGNVYLRHINRIAPVFENMGDYYYIDVKHLHIVHVLEEHGNWKLIRTAAGEKWFNSEWLPNEVLMDVPGLNQQVLGLPTGCEIVAFAMLVNKFADVDVFYLLYEMPRNYDPMLGFRGDPFTRGGFTILPPAMMDMAERHLGSAVDMTGASVEDLQAQLAIGRPVLAWLRGMFGFTVHVITLTGFNEYGFFYNDPWLGGVNEFISYGDFLYMWEDPIRDLRLNRVYPPRIALSF